MSEVEKPEVDFDHHSADYARNWEAIERELLTNRPVAWSKAHGGFWVFTRYEDVSAAMTDFATFSSENDVEGTGNGGKGVAIPPYPLPFMLTESDPPLTHKLRGFEIPFFSPKGLGTIESVIKQCANDMINRVIASGKIELVHELCLPAPAIPTMKMVGVSLDNWKEFVHCAQQTSFLPPTDPAYPLDELRMLNGILLDLVRERRSQPCGDIASALAAAKLGDVPLSDKAVVSMLLALIFGGLGTTTTCLLNALLWLNDKPESRNQLLADDKTLDNAVEEFLRVYPPVHHIARTVVKDVEVRGQQLKKGERVLLSFSAANRDGTKFERPDELHIDRPNARQHLSFSYGAHRCLGAPLARLEVKTVLKTALERLPDYRIELDKIERYPSIANLDGFICMPAQFEPKAPAN